jgi:hypothetical protein
MGPDGDTLGEKQWKWLEIELRTLGNLTLIGNGIQIMVEDDLLLRSGTRRVESVYTSSLRGLQE